MDNNFKKIAIKFGDNDFGSTFFGVLASLKDAFEYHGSLPNEKYKLVQIINLLSPVCYITYQNPFEYNGLEKNNNNLELNEEFNHSKKYLQIQEKALLLNEEVDKWLEDPGFTNSEVFIYDSTIYTNQIYSI